MRILVIAPHPDDEAIGCGGTICLHAARGDRVVAAFLTSGELGLQRLPPDEARRVREQEARAAADVLGIAAVEFLRLPDWGVGDAVETATRELSAIVERERPDLVYLPHANDAHPDHQVVARILGRAMRDHRPVPRLLAYEVWTPLASYDHVEDITTVMRRKLRALRCHASQVGYFRYDRAVHGLNQYRGALASRTRYAEVFQSVDPIAASGSGDE